MVNRELIEVFSEIAREKNVERSELATILEDLFLYVIEKEYGDSSNCSCIVNLDKGEIEIYAEKTIVDEIDDYKEKTDFTANKMITTVYASIRAYRDIMTIQRSLDAFKKLIEATHDLLKINQLKTFGSAALNHLLSLMNVESSALYIARAQTDFTDKTTSSIIACTGKYVCESDSLETSDINEQVKARIQQVFIDQNHYRDESCFVGFYRASNNSASVLYIEFEDDNEFAPSSDHRLVLDVDGFAGPIDVL